MNSRERLETAWKFREPDRVPIEMAALPPQSRELPGADRVMRFVNEQADNFSGVEGFNWGFLGLECEYREEIVEDVPGRYRRTKRTFTTEVGTFYAISKQNHDDWDRADCYWERHYIQSFEDFSRLAKAPRKLCPFDRSLYNKGCAAVGERGLPVTGLFHPLGALVRSSRIDGVYQWMVAEAPMLHAYLEETTSQVVASILALGKEDLAPPPVFMTHALEMLTPPWLGKEQFLRIVFPYDQRINNAIHSIGGRHRAHCHGNSGNFLELFADMGIDSVEPLEPPPFGDNLLTDAKKRVGRRMLLSGNVPSQLFYACSRDEVREMVRRAIEEGAPGGGFTLRLTGGGVGIGKTREQVIRSIERGLDFIEAALAWC